MRNLVLIGCLMFSINAFSEDSQCKDTALEQAFQMLKSEKVDNTTSQSRIKYIGEIIGSKVLFNSQVGGLVLQQDVLATGKNSIGDSWQRTYSILIQQSGCKILQSFEVL